MASQIAAPKFRALVLYQVGGHHAAFTDRARGWLDDLAAKKGFAIDYIRDTDTIDAPMLVHYRLFLQLDYAPYGWKPAAVAAFQNYIDQGRGGWVGLHHASLLGEFDGFPMWPWFHDFMGGIRWKDYIATFARANVHVEDRRHPVMRGVPSTFPVQTEEWYTWDRDPRPNVHVLATVDEASYEPDSKVKMGDHPVVWTNPHVKARNVYIFMGHSPDLFDNEAWKRLLTNSILWAAGG